MEEKMKKLLILIILGLIFLTGCAINNKTSSNVNTTGKTMTNTQLNYNIDLIQHLLVGNSQEIAKNNQKRINTFNEITNRLREDGWKTVVPDEFEIDENSDRKYDSNKKTIMFISVGGYGNNFRDNFIYIKFDKYPTTYVKSVAIWYEKLQETLKLYSRKKKKD